MRQTPQKSWLSKPTVNRTAVVQILKRKGRPAFAVLEIDEYDRLARAVEDAEDLAAVRASYDEELVPAEFAKRLIEGENAVRVWREYRGLSQVELAARAGIAQAYLSKIERGRRTGTAKVPRALAGALGVGLDDLA